MEYVVMQRYDIETSIGQDWEEVRSDDGEYVRYDDVAAKLAAADRLAEAVGQAVEVTVTPISGPYIQSNFSVTPADFPAIKDALTAYQSQTRKEQDGTAK